MELLEHNAEKCGYLKVLLGPMFSGKTTELMRIYNNHKSCDIPCCIINHISDTRYHKEKVGNHNGVLLPCYNYEKLIDSIELVTLFDIFLINEGQFFEDLYDVVNILVNMHKKTVYVCGLDGDFKRKKFGQILDLIPFCDEIEKLYSKCHICLKKAPFTKRITQEEGQVVIGSSNYIPLCRNCYDNYSVKK